MEEGAACVKHGGVEELEHRRVDKETRAGK